MPKQVAKRKMGWIALTFHSFMMLCTVGLWTPVLLLALRGRKTVTYVPDQQPHPQAYGRQ